MTRTGDCLLTAPLARWGSERGIYGIRPKSRIKNFRNRTFRSAFTNEQPFYALRADGEGYEGIEYELARTLQQRLNFKLLTVNRSDEEFGRRHKNNGSWTGFMKLLAEGEATFCISTLSITNERLTSVDFSSPYLYDKMTFFVINPLLLSRKYILIKPYSKQVWQALVGTFLACTAVLYLITHLLPCKEGVRRAYNIWFLLRTLGQQGTSSPAPARFSIRLFIVSWWIFILVFLWSYGGLLKSFMTHPGRRPTVDTVAKLERALQTDTIEYGTTKGTSYEFYLINDLSASHPIYGERLRQRPANLVHSVEEGVVRVLEGGYAFVYMRLVLKWFAATFGYDNFRIADDVFSNEVVGIAVQKCHPATESLSYAVERLEETGFITKWYDDAFLKAQVRAPVPDVRPVRAVNLSDIQGAFYFLGIGEGVATAVLLLEVILYCLFSRVRRYRRRRGRQKKRKCRVHFSYTVRN